MITLKEIKELYPEFYKEFSQSKHSKNAKRAVVDRVCDFLDFNSYSVGVIVVELEDSKDFYYPSLRVGDQPIELFQMNQFRSFRDAKALGVEKALAKFEFGDYN